MNRRDAPDTEKAAALLEQNCRHSTNERHQHMNNGTANHSEQSVLPPTAFGVAPARSEAAKPNVTVKPCTSPDSDFQTIDLTTTLEPNEADWADMNLTELEVIVRPDTRKTTIWQAPDDTWWRNGGHVYLRPSRDGVMRFLIVLRRGANMTDYLRLLTVVEDAKAGKFARHGWDPFPSIERPGWWYTASRPFDDPHKCVDRDAEVFACTDNRCMKTVHEASGDAHIVDTLDGDGYTIEVTRYVDEREETPAYSVYVSAWEGGVDLTPEQVASVVSDMQWVAEACRRANAAPIDSTVKGIRDPQVYWERRRALEQGIITQVAA